MHSIFEILDEASGPDLVSLADLKLALGIEGTADDAALQAQITLQSRLIAEYCDRRFGRAEAMETFVFDRSDLMLPRQALTLRLYPVAEVHEVSTAGATAAGYELDPETGRLWAPDSAWADVIAVIYSGGYDLPEEAPARLAKAVIEAVFETLSSGGRDPSIRDISHGDTRISYFTSATATANAGFLSAPVIDLIRPYRRPYAA